MGKNSFLNKVRSVLLFLFELLLGDCPVNGFKTVSLFKKKKNIEVGVDLVESLKHVS